MKNLNSQIDTMFNETIYMIEADNARRIKNLTIRFTKNNQKYSSDHLESLIVSHEKAIREISRKFLRTEKAAREKYLVPLDEERRQALLKVMIDHLEMLVEKMNRLYRDIFKNQKRLEEFDDRIKCTLLEGKQRIDEEIKKTSENLSKKLNSSSMIKPSELAKVYGLDESALIDLKVIEPLQAIHEVFESMESNQRAKASFEGIRESIIICSKFGTQIPIDPSQEHTEAARRYRKRSLVAGTLALKDLIDSMYILTQQFKLPIQNRNNDITSKTYIRLKESLKEKELLKEKDGVAKIMTKLSPFFEMLSISK
ncbi:MAG: hypothetical protein HOB32_10610 [Nitrospina sp.]|nr:hypothetical protein [Nitrospina sp.]